MTEASLPFDADEPISLTGERTAPGIPEENYWFQRHVVAYRLAATLVQGARVLDAGCGEGYGCEILSEAAASVIGVDLEDEVIRRASARYPDANFQTANLVKLPFEDGSFDAVVTFQVIEHMHTPQEFLAECARVLAPGGTLILSTPNRLTFSPEGVRNPFHAFEFAPADMRATLAQQFSRFELRGTFHGPRLRVAELLLRRSIPERLIDQPSYEWPGWLREIVRRVTPNDFAIRTSDLERCLDLLAIARV